MRRSVRQRRLRSLLVAWGLNLAAAGLLATVLLAGLEGGLGGAWPRLGIEAGCSAAAGTLAFRFPKAVGLPLLLSGAALGWLVFSAVKDFRPLTADFMGPQVQPLTDREVVTSFALRADLLETELPMLPPLYRLRPGASPPSEWWWSWAESNGWARSEGAALPQNPVKFGVYRFVLGDSPHWQSVSEANF